ncbi:MAG TPA: amidase family protein [Thermohalobaculum sp.]|nr:amidase family protein [Thermohalobaculum sp.]
MQLAEYARLDATGLAELVARREVSPRELAECAARAIEAANPKVNAVVETYADRIEGLDEAALGQGPFRGVPTLIKDIMGYEEGRLVESGSRLCQGMTSPHTLHFAELLRAAGMNILGRTNAPEYSIAGTAENALYGDTSNPWRAGYSAGGSSGGAAAAVAAGMVPAAHGTDIAGSIRIPAGWCGGVGLKPSRGRVSFGPVLDENGFGLSTTFMQTRSIRDTAALLDCLAIPQVGDPFIIPMPAEPYAELIRRAPGRLRIGWSVKPLMGVEVDPEVAEAVVATAKLLAEMGHAVDEVDPKFDAGAVARFCDAWFFPFKQRLEGYAARTGREIGPDTLEPVTLAVYRHSCSMNPDIFLEGIAELNGARRRLARVYEDCDIWLGPTLARPAEPWGRYNLGRTDVGYDDYVAEILAVPCQFTVPHNVLGTPALTLPLAMHASGLPIGVQLGAGSAQEHVLLQLGSALEEAMPWADRVPPLHVSRM